MVERKFLKEEASSTNIGSQQPRYVVESDCQTAVRTILKQDVIYSPFGNTVDECRCILESLNNVEIVFVKRSRNLAADCFALYLSMLSKIPPIPNVVIAEVCGTYFVIFAGCGSVAANKVYGGTVTFPGICITWGLIVMCMIYSVGHVSGAHFNPAITVTFAIFRRFPWKQVPFYVAAQVAGSTLASLTIRLLFDVDKDKYFGTVPAGSDIQSFVIEIIIASLQMFIVCGVATDTRAVGDLAGVAVGASVVLNVFVAGLMSGASLNPARSLGPAIVMNVYKGIWVYMVAPFVGSIAGGFVYGFLRITDKPAPK